MYYQRDRILPSSQSLLLINLGPTQYRIEPGPPERRIPFDDIWYLALQQKPIDAEAPHGNALLGIAFHTHGAYRLLGPALANTSAHVIPLSDLLGDRVLALRERLLNTADVRQKFALVQHWLWSLMAGRPETHSAVMWSAQQLQRSAGRYPVEQLVRETGFSHKHIVALFKQQIGLSPKALARLLRFRRAVKLLQGSEQIPWPELADCCGFYDQSHLINEVRAFSGFSPQSLLKHQQPDSLSIVLQ